MARRRWAASASALLVAGFTVNAYAESDGQLWTSAGVSYGVTRRAELAFEQHVRFSDDFSELDRLMPELSFGLRALSWLKLGAGYRFSYQRNNDKEWVFRHRLHVEARPGARWGDFSADYRLRFQEQLRGIDASEGGRHTLRQRLKARYAILEAWSVYASGEAFIAIGGKQGTGVSEIEWTLGNAFEVSSSELELFYRISLPTDEDDPTLHILGIGYRYDL